MYMYIDTYTKDTNNPVPFEKNIYLPMEQYHTQISPSHELLSPKKQISKLLGLNLNIIRKSNSSKSKEIN